MRYTYKDECFISDKHDITSFILLGVWVCASLVCFVLHAHMLLVKGVDDTATGTMRFVFLLVAAVIGLYIYKGIRKRRKKALARRRKALAEGTRCEGRIINAGRDVESEIIRDTDSDTNQTTEHRVYTSIYWIDVEFYDPLLQKVRQHHATHLVRGMNQFVGGAVDVLVWYEWSVYSQMQLVQTYVDTYRLG